MKIFSEEESQKVISRYTERYKVHGHSQQSLGWGKKGKQETRFQVLTSMYNFHGATVLDIGAGFGDLFKFIGPQYLKEYLGVELVPALVKEGKLLYGKYPGFSLAEGNFLEIELPHTFDITIISGLFNFKLANQKNYDFIEAILRKAFQYSNVGVASNFITDRVDYQEELIFNTNPERMVTLALSLTRNFVLRNDYFPFEYSLFLNKDDSFSPEDTIFHSYKNER